MSKTVNNYSEKYYSEKDYSKILIDRIYNLESNIINLQKAIDNLQYNHSVQSSQAHLIKVRNGIISNTGTTTTGQRRLYV
jgi:hypothetical protein